ncbi:DNA gyrase inhibitor YacG [Asticcacaulis sp. AND118]|uniref:DNA gyrase inhibitor YacG n=1 Tax=Asticcacaulis sp. AND118 TaxID=2840468 RepID=UPI000D32068A|nr:DNA gyrase inhibitor YacG [Asticcacaulis sp. AND118]UDF02596.1 DNA gyrase inhibitor YacG [Asticcacaulis sp. AND118]
MTERKCAYCRQTYQVADQTLPNAAKDYSPFCSKRCADADLMHWLKGEYVIGGTGALAAEAVEEGEDRPGSDLSSPFDDEDAV